MSKILVRNPVVEINGDEMALSEHIEEFSQRLVFCVVVLIGAILLCFADVKEIVQLFIFLHFVL